MRDTAGSPPVVIVNDAFVRAFMPGTLPVGETIPHPRPDPRCCAQSWASSTTRCLNHSGRESRRSVDLPVAQSGGGPSGRTALSLGVRPAAGAPVQLGAVVRVAALRGVDPDASFGFRPPGRITYRHQDHRSGSWRSSQDSSARWR